MIYRVRGSGFLKHMVRNLVGYLLEAGKGNVSGFPPPDRRVGPTAPAKGLTLHSVEF
jgi:tRNA pseudouridine38-40 synthase